MSDYLYTHRHRVDQANIPALQPLRPRATARDQNRRDGAGERLGGRQGRLARSDLRCGCRCSEGSGDLLHSLCIRQWIRLQLIYDSRLA